MKKMCFIVLLLFVLVACKSQNKYRYAQVIVPEKEQFYIVDTIQIRDPTIIRLVEGYEYIMEDSLVNYKDIMKSFENTNYYVYGSNIYFDLQKKILTINRDILRILIENRYYKIKITPDYELLKLSKPSYFILALINVNNYNRLHYEERKNYMETDLPNSYVRVVYPVYEDSLH